MTGPISGVEKYQHKQIPEHQLEVFGLPMELVHVILQRLPLKDMVGCSLLGKAMYQITFDTDLWKTLYLRDFPSQPPMKDFPLETYKDCRRYHSNIVKGVYASRIVPFDEQTRWNDGSCVFGVGEGKCCGGFHGGKIKIWDSKTWECSKSFQWDEGNFQTLILADGNLILGSYDGTIKVRDLEKENCVKIFIGHENAIRFFALADGKLISEDCRGTIKIWDRKTWECLKTLDVHRDGPYPSIVIDGKLFSGCGEGTIEILDLKTGDSVSPLEGHEYGVTSLALAGRKLVSGDRNGTINIWDLEQKACLKSLSEHTRCVVSLLWAEEKLFSLSEDETIKIWDVEKGVCLTTIKAGYGARSLAFTGEMLVILYPGKAKFKILDFKAKDDEIFEEIAGLLKGGSHTALTYAAEDALPRFYGMPKLQEKKSMRNLASFLIVKAEKMLSTIAKASI